LFFLGSHSAGHNSDAEKTTTCVEAEERAALLLELEEALSEAGDFPVWGHGTGLSRAADGSP
jgi:hypothetical protein